jgi:glutathione S-transferase
MIKLYSWPTGNGRRASIMLEESGLPYTVHAMDLSTKVQKQPWYIDLAPLGRIPVIVDDDGQDQIVLFESGAILIYLAEKAGRLLPAAAAARAETLKWLFFGTSNLSPLAMQVHRLTRLGTSGRPDHILNSYREDLTSLYDVMDRALADREFLAGDYSIADIAAYPWVYRHKLQEIQITPFANLLAWMTRIGARPAVQRGMNIPPRTDGM